VRKITYFQFKLRREWTSVSMIRKDFALMWIRSIRALVHLVGGDDPLLTVNRGELSSYFFSTFKSRCITPLSYICSRIVSWLRATVSESGLEIPS